jgi:cytochrome b pre-mRNA-processing protein 3
MNLKSFFRRQSSNTAEALYSRIVDRARNPVFYRDYGIPDTPEGRFEMVALHVFLVLRRIKAEGTGPDSAAGNLGQGLFDCMFTDMDRSLREMGIGDLGVGRRVKALAQGFYGCIAAYEAGLDEGDAALETAIARNLYDDAPPPGAARAMSGYMRRAAEQLAEIPATAVLDGAIAFVVPSAEAAGEDLR